MAGNFVTDLQRFGENDMAAKNSIQITMAQTLS